MKMVKEEIAASFDREIRKDQEQVRRVRQDREKAKDKGIAGRIEMVVFVLILTLAFRVFVFLAPFILMVMVATFVVRIVRNWIGKF